MVKDGEKDGILLIGGIGWAIAAIAMDCAVSRQLTCQTWGLLF